VDFSGVTIRHDHRPAVLHRGVSAGFLGLYTMEVDLAQRKIGLNEPYRVFRRLHFEGGWSPWDDQAIFHQRSASERFGWFSSTATSTTRSGPRFARSPR